MVGLATAWHLQQRGIDVTVLDREGVAAGSSWGNAGWLTPALTMPIAEPSVLRFGLRAMASPSSPIYVPMRANKDLLRFLAGFARHCTPAKWRAALSIFTTLNQVSLDAYAELVDGGVSAPPRIADPFIAGFSTDSDREHLVEAFEHITEFGGKVEYELVDGDQLQKLEPVLARGVTSGILIKGQRFINPGEYVNALAAAVRLRGAQVITDAQVIDVNDRTGRTVSLRSTDGRIWSADIAVLATGTWLGTLARPFGVKQVVQAGRGYSFSVATAAPVDNPIYLPAQRVACTPLGDRLRVAGMMEFRPPDAPLDPRRIDAIIDAAKPMLDGIDWDDRRGEWVGSRPCTADGLPLIGRTKSERVYVTGGHGMWGIALGPLSGRLLADQITGAAQSPLMQHLNPLR